MEASGTEVAACGAGQRKSEKRSAGRTDLAEGIFVAPHLICQVVGIYC